jgi:hypothetical protein
MRSQVVAALAGTPARLPDLQKCAMGCRQAPAQAALRRGQTTRAAHHDGHSAESSMSETTPDEWLTLAKAAAERGLSEKTLRKRIAAGLVTGQKVPLEGGGMAWRVQPMGGCESSAPVITEPRAGTVPEVKSTVPVAERNIAPEVTGTRAGSAPVAGEDAAKDARLAELRDEVKFLRSALEARDRDAAELRAALREALKMSNRALPAPNDESPPQAPQRAENAPAGNQAQPAKRGQQRPAEREARALWARLLGYRPKW